MINHKEKVNKEMNRFLFFSLLDKEKEEVCATEMNLSSVCLK